MQFQVAKAIMHQKGGRNLFSKICRAPNILLARFHCNNRFHFMPSFRWKYGFRLHSQTILKSSKIKQKKEKRNKTNERKRNEVCLQSILRIQYLIQGFAKLPWFGPPRYDDSKMRKLRKYKTIHIWAFIFCRSNDSRKTLLQRALKKRKEKWNQKNKWKTRLPSNLSFP